MLSGPLARMDPTNPQFEVQCQSNPALYTKCAIQWMGQWSAQGYAEVPQPPRRRRCPWEGGGVSEVYLRFNFDNEEDDGFCLTLYRPLG